MMFIKRIEIGQFGKLKDISLDFKPGANLIVAPNEWGKSTLIDFIFAVFYGMDHNKADLRSSNRSRNMPWEQDSMSGALFYEAAGLAYRVSCEFGAQKRLDHIILTDESLAASKEIDGEPLGKHIFGLGQHAFNQSVYVQQMSLALNVKDDKQGELLHQLASLGTAGTSDISSTAVSKNLKEALLSLSSSQRQNAVIPQLENERFQLQTLLTEAREREAREAEELLELHALNAEVEFLADRVRTSERQLQKTEYLIQLQNLQESLREEHAIRNQQDRFRKQLEQLESLQPSVSAEEFLDLEKVIRQLQVESSALENNSRSLEMEGGALQHELNQAFSKSKTLDPDAGEELSFHERRQELRRRDQACDKEMRAAYARQQQKEMNRSRIQEELTGTIVPNTEGQEKKYRILGLALILLAFASALLVGFMWHPGAFGLALIAGPGFYFFRKSKEYSSVRVKTEEKRIELETSLTKAETELAAVTAEVGQLEAELALLDEAQNLLEDEESQILQRQQEARVREESYSNNLARHLERRTKFCDAIDSLLASYPYLNTDAIVDKIKSSQVLPQLKDLEYSSSSRMPAYPAQLFEEETDAGKRRYSEALRLFKRFADSYFELNNYVQDLKQSRHQLREHLRVLSSGQGSDRLLPAAKKQQLLEQAAAAGFPVTERDIAIAIEEEEYPEDLNKSLAGSKQELQFSRNRYSQALSEHSKKQAHMALAYRYSERSENIEIRLQEVDERIARAEARVRQLELALKYLAAADEEMRRNFSPELRKLTAGYLAKLTLGRYDDVLIDRDMKLQLHIAGETQFREAEYMSGGTYDQVYLALRLALSELITGEQAPPLILDDVLVQFDEKRMEAALDLLAELSREKSARDSMGESRQILLFSCHERLAEAAESVGGFDIQRL
jgi:DNA repair exonuclease SbcCD ATPase subunit